MIYIRTSISTYEIKYPFVCHYFNKYFFQRLKAKIIKVVDISYGGINGLNQAIDLAMETLGNLKFVHEKKLIGKS